MKERKGIPIFFSAGSMIKMDDVEIVTDPYGSYTGVLPEPWELPVQDADDL